MKNIKLIRKQGQTIESIADDLLFFKEIDADMIGVGPFIPNLSSLKKSI